MTQSIWARWEGRKRYPFVVVVAEGCYRGPDAPMVSRHRTLRAAVIAARRSDRTRVERADRGGCLFQARSQQPTRWGYGLYGMGDTRPVRVCLAEAERALAE